MNGLRTVAPAKVNLYLHVLGKDARGYHLLESLVAFTEFGDRLEVYPADALSLEINGPFAADAGALETNLVLRAARGLAAEAGIERPGARLVLTKNIPVAAGVGGGSSDAAAAIRLLSRLWQIRLSADDLEALAIRLGADVPVCLFGRSAVVRGVGEKVDAATKLPECWIVLANPGVPLATHTVFGSFTKKGGHRAVFWPTEIADLQHLTDLLSQTRNDLLPSAQKHAPEIQVLLRIMSGLPECSLARMSGSGATCFGFFSSRTVAVETADYLRQELGIWAVTTRLRSRRACINKL